MSREMGTIARDDPVEEIRPSRRRESRRRERERDNSLQGIPAPRGGARSHSNGMLEKASSSSGRCSVVGSIGFQVKSCFCVVTSCIGPLPSNCLSHGVIGISGLTHQLPRKLNCDGNIVDGWFFF